MKRIALLVVDLADLDPKKYPTLNQLYGPCSKGEKEIAAFIRAGLPVATILAEVFFENGKPEAVTYSATVSGVLFEASDDWHELAAWATDEWIDNRGMPLSDYKFAVFDGLTGRFVEILKGVD